jgi:Flp pilus assembly pilin Flp
MVKVIKQFWNDESGQGLPEYALLVAAVVVMVIVAASLFTDDVQNLFNSIGDEINSENKITTQ